MALIDPERWRRLEPLLDRVLELPVPERANWLKQFEADSPDLAADLIRLVEAEATANRRGFLAEPKGVSLAGVELGAYTIERPLGQGGMGTVWLARRTDGRFEGRAAVKLMNLALLSPIGQERFHREGTVLARLEHPGIARLLDAGVAASGQPYLVIEYVEGQRINHFADAARLSREQRIGLVLQVLEAVGHAHANLIVHRDIKPSNILVTPAGRAKLLDFGIAKLLEGDASAERSALTSEGGSALTPDYAAPEQVRGETVTTATDVYALGVLLYLLLAGRHPTNASSSTPVEAARSVLEVEPRRLGLGDLDTIIAKALRKAPGERYQTVASLAEDLRRYLRQEPVSARPDSIAYRAGKFVRRNRAAVSGAALIAAVLLGATAFSVRQMGLARQQRDAAVRSARRANAMSELQGVLAGDNRGPDGEPLSPADRIALAEQVLVRQFRGEPWLVAEVMTDLSGRFIENADYDARLRMLARARSIARESRQLAQVALAGCARATTFWINDQLDSMRSDLADAEAALVQAGTTAGDVTRAACLEAEGKLAQATGNPDSGVALLRRAVELVGSESSEATKLAMRGSLSDLLRLAGRPREAAPFQASQLAQVDSSGYGDTQTLPIAASILERSLADLGEFKAIDSVLTGLIRDRESRRGAGKVPTLLAFLYGQNQLRLGRLDSADLWLARARRDTSQNAALGNWLPPAVSLLRLEQGRLEEARVEIARLPGGLRGRRASAAMLRGMLRRAEGDERGAPSLLETELAALYRESPKTQTLFTLPLVTAAEWRLAVGDARGADSLARLAKTAAAIDSLALTRSALVGRAELSLARALAAENDQPAAREAAQRASVALSSGYGEGNRWTRTARALIDSLSR